MQIRYTRWAGLSNVSIFMYSIAKNIIQLWGKCLTGKQALTMTALYFAHGWFAKQRSTMGMTMFPQIMSQPLVGL